MKQNVMLHRVSALDPLADASHYGRHRPWDIEGRASNIALAVSWCCCRDAGARPTAIGYVIMLLVGLFAGSHARHPHEGAHTARSPVHRAAVPSFLDHSECPDRESAGSSSRPTGSRRLCPSCG